MRTTDSRMSNSLAAKKHNADIPPGSNEILTIDLDDQTAALKFKD